MPVEEMVDEQFYADLLDRVTDGVYFVDQQRRITYWSRGAEEITGYSAGEVLGRSCSEGLLRHVSGTGRQLCLNGCPLTEVMTDGNPRAADVYLHHKDGHRVPVTVQANARRDGTGAITGCGEIFSPRGASAYASLDHRVRDHSLDAVTGLPTRRFGELHVATLAAAVREAAASLGVLFVDADLFKQVNDEFGHGVGDQVLRMVGQSLANGLRRGDLPVRWGGEEFLALLPGIDARGLQVTAERVRMLVANSWLQHGPQQIGVTVSVGATLAVAGETAGDVVDRADRLMYRAKASGRNRVVCDAPTSMAAGPTRSLRGSAGTLDQGQEPSARVPGPRTGASGRSRADAAPSF